MHIYMCLHNPILISLPGIFSLVNCLLSAVRDVNLAENEAASKVSKPFNIIIHNTILYIRYILNVSK